MGDFDRIIKNNIERIILNLATRYLGLEIAKIQRIREKLQVLEREADFAAFVSTSDGEKFILQISPRFKASTACMHARAVSAI